MPAHAEPHRSRQGRRTMAADFVWKSALIMYFFSWVWGTLWDVGIQEPLYLKSAHRIFRHWCTYYMCGCCSSMSLNFYCIHYYSCAFYNYRLQRLAVSCHFFVSDDPAIG